MRQVKPEELILLKQQIEIIYQPFGVLFQIEGIISYNNVIPFGIYATTVDAFDRFVKRFLPEYKSHYALPCPATKFVTKIL